MAAVIPALAGCGDDGGEDAFCAAATDTASFEAIFDDLDPDDVASATEAFREARDTEIELRRDAPDAIRADLDLLVQFLDDLVDGLEGADPDMGGSPAVYEEVRSRFAGVEAASERIEDYVRANCTTTSTS